jgi:glutathione S-transferase/GST-like protein
MIDVYTWEPNANSGKPLLGLREKNLAFTHHYVDMGKREHHAPDYLKINPGGTIPTVIDNGYKMTESTPFLEYMDDAHDGPSLVPSDPYEAWRMRWWCRYLDRDICPALAMVASNALAAPMLAGQTAEQRKEALDRIPLPERRRTWELLYANATPKSEIEESQRRISACIALMEETLSKQPYLAGASYSLAEIVALITMYGWPLRDDVGEAATPHLWLWFKRCLSRPAYKATFDKANAFMGGRAKDARAKLGLAE